MDVTAPKAGMGVMDVTAPRGGMGVTVLKGGMAGMGKTVGMVLRGVMVPRGGMDRMDARVRRDRTGRRGETEMMDVKGGEGVEDGEGVTGVLVAPKNAITLNSARTMPTNVRTTKNRRKIRRMK